MNDTRTETVEHEGVRYTVQYDPETKHAVITACEEGTV